MNVTLKVGLQTLEKIRKAYADEEVANAGDYAVFAARLPDAGLIAYKSAHPGRYTLAFSGPGALKEALRWDKEAKEIMPHRRPAPRWLDVGLQIGSDEVGTGDFFGPVSVAACLVREGDEKRLRELGVDDSKKLSDGYIREIAPIIIGEFPYSQVLLPPAKLNDLVLSGENMNSLKAKMHNQVLLNLRRRHPGVIHIYQDQFVPEKQYYSYLTDTKVVVRKVRFKTKGESYYPSVALASIVARYSFLRKMDELSRKVGFKLPFGAGEKADEAAKRIAKEKGLAFLARIVKKHFVNYERVRQE